MDPGVPQRGAVLSRIHLDTSLLVSALLHEQGTAAAHRYLLELQAGTWLISTWVNTEFASALSLKCRSGVISRDELMACWQSFQTLCEKRLQVLQLEHADFETAARLCLADVPLRAGDALHLALCQRQRGVLATLDQGLARAALHHQLRLAMIA